MSGLSFRVSDAMMFDPCERIKQVSFMFSSWNSRYLMLPTKTSLTSTSCDLHSTFDVLFVSRFCFVFEFCSYIASLHDPKSRFLIHLRYF
ncbi:hypothetical protein E1A91_D11G357500v1 [Gossypium mustelinum]|uniref:Uncharacterized protein n=2 Tax=Gossypium TaxID=3633 RepID=A0A5J5NAV7_GOSBA|nr:hypothetical protein ES319_1Z070400v1 [Gossypium barbadense]KAB1670110.1 hypothetical protein ES319_1Z198500v1 [Gossypium barbadense]TYI58428.1 hypothetical protein E1A91_D11G357500v1 [Gossypium mustelinum]